jgi:serine/threonine-protein kinase
MRDLQEHSAHLASAPPFEAGRSTNDPQTREDNNGANGAPKVRDSKGVLTPNNAISGTPVQAPSWVFCGHCGDKIGIDDVFCAHCGARQPLVGSASPNAAGTPGGRITAQLVILGTSEMVKPFPIEKESVLLGRTDPHTGIFPEIDLTMFDPETKVSRRHARIYRQGEQFLVEDLGSVNGTVVNSVNGGSIRLNTKSPRVLSAGDELKLGGTLMKFMLL